MPHFFISPPATGCSIEIVHYRLYGIAWQLYDAKGLYCPFRVEENAAPNNVENPNTVPS